MSLALALAYWPWLIALDLDTSVVSAVKKLQIVSKWQSDQKINCSIFVTSCSEFGLGAINKNIEKLHFGAVLMHCVTAVGRNRLSLTGNLALYLIINKRTIASMTETIGRL